MMLVGAELTIPSQSNQQQLAETAGAFKGAALRWAGKSMNRAYRTI